MEEKRLEEMPVYPLLPIQKLPQLFEVIHAIIEEKRGIQFVLTGSSGRNLRRTGVNLLGGRALRVFLGLRSLSRV